MRCILLSLLLFCTMSKMELVTENAVQIQTYSPTTETAEVETDETALRYYGNCRITFYDSCPSCCGQWAYGATASGVMPTANHTVANGSLPFGTKVIIDGVEYVVEDRGVGGDQFDIYVNNHGEIPSIGLYYTDVYIVD